MRQSLPEVGDLHFSSGVADASLPSQTPVKNKPTNLLKSKPISLADIYARNITERLNNKSTQK